VKITVEDDGSDYGYSTVTSTREVSLAQVYTAAKTVTLPYVVQTPSHAISMRMALGTTRNLPPNYGDIPITVRMGIEVLWDGPLSSLIRGIPLPPIVVRAGIELVVDIHTDGKKEDLFDDQTLKDKPLKDLLKTRVLLWEMVT
jgi:hypothetical protein